MIHIFLWKAMVSTTINHLLNFFFACLPSPLHHDDSFDSSAAARCLGVVCREDCALGCLGRRMPVVGSIPSL